jgi:hypothetical protein
MDRTETVRKLGLGTGVVACFAGIGLRNGEELPVVAMNFP